MPRERARRSQRGEFERIERLIAHLPRAAGTVIGPGDDAAVVRPRAGLDLVVTTDALVEGRHYDPAWGRLRGVGGRLADWIGARLAAANLSDLAAMGATPRWAVLSAGVTAAGADRLDRTQRVLARALARQGAALVGGNLCRVSGPEWLSLTLIGEVKRGRALTRSGARAGDWIAITGRPGRAAAFVALANAGTLDRALAAAWSSPPARIEFARTLAARRWARAAIDISDGLAADLAHLARASGVSAVLETEAFAPDERLARALRRAGPARQRALALGPSDDYELIIAIPPACRARCELVARASRTPLTFVGRLSRGAPGVVLLRDARGTRRRIAARGFDHFASSRGRQR